VSGIAIVGMAGRFPGAPDLETFWETIRDGRENVSSHGMRAGAAGRLDGVDRFDAAYFGMSPAEAELTDPQHRLFLECCVEALDDAGYPAGAPREAAGVFASAASNNYLLHHIRDARGYRGRVDELLPLIGADKDYLATRVSYLLDLRGPSLSVQTACSSSLVAAHLACQSLLAGECDLALAGGVCIRVPQEAGYDAAEGGVFSPSGHCRPFDRDADGAVFGAGAGVVVLKRLEDATLAGDRIYAVILGSAVNNDGAGKAAFPAPSVDGQVRVVAESMAVAGVDASLVSYVECHGTGTRLGDAVEVAALARAFGRTPAGSCALGSVKANIGHLENAAGVAGLIKVALCLHRRTLPPACNFSAPHPDLGWEETRFYAARAAARWAGPRLVAGVSSFGIGGTNAHLTLQAAADVTVNAADERPRLLCLSCAQEAARAELNDAWREWLERARTPWRAVAYTAAARRAHRACRVAVVARSTAEAARALGEGGGAVIEGCAVPLAPIAFVYPGQGGQWSGMGRELLAEEAVFGARVDEVDREVRAQFGWSVRAEIESGARITGERIEITQVALFALQSGLTALWRSWGVEPDAVIGHSMGEIAAAEAAGILTLGEAVRLAGTRARLLERATGQGAMLCVFTSESEAAALANGAGMETAAANAPGATVLSGPRAAAAEVADRLRRAGVEFRTIETTGVAGHSSQVEDASRELEAGLELNPVAGAVRMMSTVEAGWVNGAALGPAYWRRNLRRPVRFLQAARELLREGFTRFLEIGAHPALGAAIAEIAAEAGKPVAVLESMRRGEGSRAALLASAARLWTGGQALRWEAVAGPATRPASLPAYAWSRQRYWIDESSGAPAAAWPGAYANCSFDPAVHLWMLDLAGPFWSGHRVAGRAVLPFAAYVELLRGAVERLAPGARVVLRGLEIQEPLETDGATVQTVLRERGAGSWSATIHACARPGEWRLHATAEVASDGVTADAVDSACRGEPRPAAEFYATLAASGVEYAPAFRRLARLVVADGEAAGELDAALYCGDPGAVALLDAAMQPLLALVHGAHWPVRAAEIRLGRRPGARSQTRVRLHRESDRISGDVTLTTATEGVAMEIRGLELARIASPIPIPCQRVEWTPAAPSTGPARVGRWRVSGEPGMAAALAAGLRARGCEVDDAPVDGGVAGAVRVVGEAGAEECLAVRDLLAGCACANVPVWLVTRGAHAPDGTGAAAAPVWGLRRSALTETPGLCCGAVDANGAVEQVVHELLHEAPGEEVRLDGGRSVARLTPGALEPRAELRLHGDRTYVVAGAFGGLGILTAEHLARRGARHLLLLGRSAPSAAAGARVDALRADADVRTLVCDLAGAGCGRAIAEALRPMPPVAGAIHAAGHLEDGMLDSATAASFARVLAPKVLGAQRLAEALEREPLDFLVFYGSAAALVGSPGQAAHAAANSFLPAYARSLQARGVPAVAIAWGPWLQVGRAAASVATLAERGLAGLEPEAALGALDAVLAAPPRDSVGLFDFDLTRWAAYYPHAARAPWFERLRREPAGRKGGLLQELAALPQADARAEALERYLAQEAAAILRRSANAIDPERPLREAGLDSLRAFELRNRIEAALGIRVAATSMWRHPTPRRLAAFLLREAGLCEPVAATARESDTPASVGRRLEEVERELLRLARTEALDAAQ
jgi:acyl transferase domain-containing protein